MNIVINVIVACDRNGGIGKNHGMPWPPIKEDMAWFKKSTMNDVVVMGSSTWNSFGMKKPLPDRVNAVFTSDPSSCPGADIYLSGSVTEELRKLESYYPGTTIWVIGGADIIKQCSDIIDFWYITRLPDVYNCDTFVPMIWDNTEYECLYQDIKKNVMVSLVPRRYEDIVFEIWGKDGTTINKKVD